MKRFLKELTLIFGAGMLGGLAKCLVIWLFGHYGITAKLGVKIASTLSATWLYPRLVWGGIWGTLFLLPLLKRRVFKRGLLLSLGPSLVQIFVVFPQQAQAGYLGMGLGALTPVLVLLFNAIWGVMAAWWIRYVMEA